MVARPQGRQNPAYERTPKRPFYYVGPFLLLGVLGLFEGFDDSREGGGFADSEVGEDFAVELDIVGFELGDELAVGQAFLSGGVVDAGNPEGAEVAFFVATVAVGVAQTFDNTLFGHTIAAGAVVLHAFGASQDLFMLGTGWDASFDSHN